MKVNGKHLSDIQIIENLTNILVGGFETTASALGYCLLALAMHPEIQEKCFDELIKKFPDEKMELTPENIKKLTYLDMVIKETMRLFPPIPVSARQNMSDLDVGDYVFPKDTILVLNIFKLHRDKELWGDDCLQFNPEHFSPENIAKRHIFAFLPFTAGNRNCIGGRYALTSLKVGLAHILRQYKFSTPLKMNDLVFKLSITLKITNGFMVQLSKRTKDEHV
ncbi:probable cytochrome P450 313a4 [Culicoides brevitarsis]|uniref:probable cytochrome P450 313a4 n=1 Tax=Culicoides brevitarsis TaxID=469753 RepID=UPI00307B75F0